MILKLASLAAVVAVAGLLEFGCGSNNCTATTPTACPASPPSYASDVEPLIQKYCTSCHAPGGQEADVPLTSFAHVKQRSDDVEGEVGSCDMPPSDEAQPTDAEREILLAWIVCGASNN